MKPDNSDSNNYAAFIGIDRSDKKIDITTLAPDGTHLGHRQISSKPNSLKDWILELRQQFSEGQLALCIEQPCANLAAFFIQFEFIDLLLINPATFRKWHDAFKPSKARDDASDSAGLAELAQQNHCKLTVWKPDDAQTRQLRSLLESRRSLVDLRTKLNNQLISVLKNYYYPSLRRALQIRFAGRYPLTGQSSLRPSRSLGNISTAKSPAIFWPSGPPFKLSRKPGQRP